MNKKQNSFNPESMLKGRMAETLVEELIRKSGNSIYRFGYEAILQNLSQIQQNFDRNTEAGERIRAIPDFIVIDKNGNPLFLEVKFRWDGKLHDDDRKRLERIQNFWSVKIIFVNCFEKPFFRISSPPYLDQKGSLTYKPLIEEISWKIDKAVYEEFEALVGKYLTPTLISKWRGQQRNYWKFKWNINALKTLKRFQSAGFQAGVASPRLAGNARSAFAGKFNMVY